MDVMRSPTIQTIHLSSAGRAAAFAHLLAPEQGLATAIGDWTDRLVASAPELDIMLNTHDVRSLLPESIELLDDVFAKSHPVQLRGYGPLDTTTCQVLEQWCARSRTFVATLVSVWRLKSTPASTSTCVEHGFPEALALSRYQRNALIAYLQVADDALRSLGSILRLARAPYAPLFSSSLAPEDIACCEAACVELASVLGYGHAWVAQMPIDRRRSMILEYLRDAETVLGLLFEGMSGWQRQILAELLTDLSRLKRRV